MYKKKLLIRAALIFVVLSTVLLSKKVFAPEKGTKTKKKIVKTKKLTSGGHMIPAMGTLEPEQMFEVGPNALVPGVVQELYVNENDPVTKGQVLAYIDDSRDDNLVRETEAAWKAAQAALTYQQAFYNRQKALYAKQFISQDFFEQVTRDLVIAQEEVKRTKAIFDQGTLEFVKKQVVSPADGIVIRKNVTLGQTVTLEDQPTVIYILASDLSTMMLNLEVDQSYISKVRPNMRAIITFDSFPDETYTGLVKDISNDPMVDKDGTVKFTVRVIVDNSLMSLRPGMAAQAKVTVPMNNDDIMVPQTAFKIDKDTLLKTAKARGYAIKELSDRRRNAIKDKDNMRTLWLQENDRLIEAVVEVTKTGKIIAGLVGNEEIVVDTLT